MADYKEAIKNLQTIHGMPLTIRMAIEALEKQIPKKPIRQHEKYHRWYNDKFFCPSCGESAETDCGDPFENYGLDWCNHCGQAIDWSDE